MKKTPIEKKKKWLLVTSLFCLLWFVFFFACGLEYAVQLEKIMASRYFIVSIVLAVIGGICWAVVIKEDDHD
jgi:glucan phosphoethanolaminetransferase (alkaline phosphatase superfamily)